MRVKCCRIQEECRILYKFFLKNLVCNGAFTTYHSSDSWRHNLKPAWTLKMADVKHNKHHVLTPRIFSAQQKTGNIYFQIFFFICFRYGKNIKNTAFTWFTQKKLCECVSIKRYPNICLFIVNFWFQLSLSLRESFYINVIFLGWLIALWKK